VNVVPPLGFTRWTRYTGDSFVVGEQLALHVERLQRPQGRLPILFFHDYLHDAVTDLDGAFDGVFSAATSPGYPLLAPSLGGMSQWATPDVVDAGGHVDDALDWAAGQVWIDTRADKVAILAFRDGHLNALNWAWRNPGKVASVALVGPIVDAEAFYDSNPGLQAAINADWGSGAAWTAALPDIDPMQNLDAIRPFGHKIKLWYGDADTQIAAADVQAFAELVGATAVEFTGTQADRHLVPADQVAVFTLATIRDKDRAYVGWDERDWDRFQSLTLTVPADPTARNVNTRRTVVAPGGRRGEFVRLSGSESNERFMYLLPEVQAPDMSVKNVWHNGDGGLLVGQHGNPLRAFVDPDTGAYLAYMAWSNIFFAIPWIINRAVWAGTLGEVGPPALLGLTNSVIPGLRLSAGGQVLASERSGNVVTLTVLQDDADRAYRSALIDIEMAGPLGDFTGLVARIDANHLQYTQAGADVTSGGPGSWADFASCFPHNADTDIVGDTMRGRFYPIGMDPPPMGDPDWGFTWTDTGGWGHTGYGYGGVLFAHVGINTPGQTARMQLGPLTIDEL